MGVLGGVGGADGRTDGPWMAVRPLDPSRVAVRLPGHGVEVHAGEVDGVGTIHPLWLRLLPRWTRAAQVVGPPGV